MRSMPVAGNDPAFSRGGATMKSKPISLAPVSVAMAAVLAVLAALLTLGLCPESALADDKGEHGQAAAYLKMGIGGRPLGMGGAFAAIADDATAAYWNPAGLAQLKASEATTMHAVLNMDRRLDFVNYAHLLEDGSVWALSWTGFGVDKIEERAGPNDPRGYAAGELVSYFEDSENSYTGSYAWRVKPNLDLGVSIKYMNQMVADASARCFGLDVGLLYRVNDKFHLGAVAKDISSDLQWDTGVDYTDPIPYSARVGMMFRPRPSLTFALDVQKYQFVDAELHFGVEGWIKEMFAIRAGVDDGDISLGSSVKIRDWEIDYSFTDRNFGDVHRVSGRHSF